MYFQRANSPRERKVRKSKHALSLFCFFFPLPHLLMDLSNSNMDVKRTSPSTTTTEPRSKTPALHDATDPTQKAKEEQCLRAQVKFQEDQGRHRPNCLGWSSQTHLLILEAEAHDFASAANLNPNFLAVTQPLFMYQLPVGLNHISNALKTDDPPTKIRVGPMSNFTEKIDLANGSKYWIGLAWAEIFFPVTGERPASVIGSKAYEVVLKQPIADGGAIVRENVVTTGRVVGMVHEELLHETVSVRIEDWFVRSEMFQKGRWR